MKSIDNDFTFIGKAGSNVYIKMKGPVEDIMRIITILENACENKDGVIKFSQTNNAHDVKESLESIFPDEDVDKMRNL